MKILTNLDLSQNEIQNAIMQPLAAPPSNPKLGQIYFNSIDLTLYLWTGEKWIPVPTNAGKSLGEKISRNRHGLDADGNPLPDPSGNTLNNEEAKG